MNEEMDIVRDVSAKLEQGRIDYMLTGSMAMNYYAQPRMTRDIDLVVALSEADVGKVVNIFAKEYYLSVDAVRSSIANSSMFNLIHNETVIKVDCIVRKQSEYRLIEFQRRQRIRIEDFDTWIVSKEDLIISKLLWAKDSLSELQLRDVRNLLVTGCERDYVAVWAQRLGVTELWQQMLER